jgi:hypothetical protein
MAEPLEGRLRAWRDAGLIDDGAAAAIEAFEAARTATPPTTVAEAVSRPDRTTVAEALAYAGFAVVLAGILYALFSSFGGATAGPISLVLAACATGLAAVLDRDGGPSARRAAGASMAVAVGLAALGVGTVLVNAGVYTTTYMLDSRMYLGDLTVVQHNDAALAAIAAAVAVVFGAASLRWVATPLLALVVAAAAEVTAFTSTHAAGGDAAQRWGFAPLVSGACLVALASAPRLAAAAGVLRFIALAVAPPALLVVGGISDAPTWPLIVLATAIAAGSMAASVQVGRASLAAAGGIGVLSVAIDVTQRTLGSNGNASVVLIVSGLLLVGCAALTERAMRRARRQGAALA